MMSDTTLFIDEYFRRWERDLNKVSDLLSDTKYYLEGILVLSCYLGAFASSRYPQLYDGEAYVKFVLEYSGRRPFYEQIDLLFFYQWPKSKLRNKGNYKKLRQHTEIVQCLNRKYGNEDDLKSGTRYISASEFIDSVKAAKIPKFDEQNLQKILPLFSISELLYRYLRCDAVHNAEYPFINEVRNADGTVVYRDNHIITGSVLFKTTREACNSLWDECRTKEKFPDEL